jgi:hypothetical protein
MALEPTSSDLVLAVTDVDVRSLNGSRVYSAAEVQVRLLASAHRQEALLGEILAALTETPKAGKPRKGA